MDDVIDYTVDSFGYSRAPRSLEVVGRDAIELTGLARSLDQPALLV